MKTSELKGKALDWSVAKSEGLELKLDPMGFKKDHPESTPAGWWVWEGQFGIEEIVGLGYAPSLLWSQGGPIIEREKIGTFANYKEWFASKDNPETMDVYETGASPLEAAMRCYVASKLGDEVEIPEELL